MITRNGKARAALAASKVSGAQTARALEMMVAEYFAPAIKNVSDGANLYAVILQTDTSKEVPDLDDQDTIEFNDEMRALIAQMRMQLDTIEASLTTPAGTYGD